MTLLISCGTPYVGAVATIVALAPASTLAVTGAACAPPLAMKLPPMNTKAARSIANQLLLRRQVVNLVYPVNAVMERPPPEIVQNESNILLGNHHCPAPLHSWNTPLRGGRSAPRSAVSADMCPHGSCIVSSLSARYCPQQATAKSRYRLNGRHSSHKSDSMEYAM